MQHSVALIGCGYWGKNLARVISEVGALKAVCESSLERIDFLNLHYPNIPITENLNEVLSDPEITGVAIATPAATHYSIVKQSLESGKHVFVEKPLALTYEEGKELVSISENLKLTLMVGHLLLYHPAIIKLNQLIQSGELGRILYCYSNRLNIGKIRTEENILWSFAPHDLSVMLHILGEVPTEVTVSGESYLNPGVADETMSILKFQSGVSGHIFVSWLHPFKEQRLIIVGSKQMAVFDDTSENKLVVYPHRVDWIGRSPQAIKGEAEIINIESTEPLREEILHFLECIEFNKTPRTDGREALNVLQALQACQHSLERGETIHLKKSADELTGNAQRFFAHESACVDAPEEIGEGTRIWHFSHVCRGARVGKNCSIGQNVYIAPEAIIGNNSKIQNNVSIYDKVILEDDVFCGPSVVFTNVRNPRCQISRKNEYVETRISRGASLGANCTIVCGNHIGKYAFIAAGATVTQDVPAFALMAGVPAKQLGWFCGCAESRIEFEEQETAECPKCGASYVKTETGIECTSYETWSGVTEILATSYQPSNDG